MSVYHAHPREAGRNMAIMVFMEAFGVNGHIQDICHRLAYEGYDVYAPDLYYRFGDKLQFDYSDRQSALAILHQLKKEELSEDIKALFDFIQTQHPATPVASIGFCVGGYIAVLSAIKLQLITAVSYYGAGLMHDRAGFKLLPLQDQFFRIQAPLLFFFGAKDASIPKSEVEEISQRLRESGKEFQVKVFENANHGFFCGQRGSYHAEAAHASWHMTLDWLKKFYSMTERSNSVSSGDGLSTGDSSTV